MTLQRDYVGRWHVNLHQSADYVHTSRQIVMQVQEAVNKAICEGDPSYDESELMEDYGCFLLTKGRRASDWVKYHAVWKVADGKYFIGGKWPTMEVDVIDNEIWEEHMPNVPTEEIDHSAQSVDEESKEDPKPVFFVTISRHSGFRRLHKIGCCSTQPWTCYKVEYLSRVGDGAADAICKTCQRALGKATDVEGSSTSGSSSSTDVEAKADEEGTQEVLAD